MQNSSDKRKSHLENKKGKLKKGIFLCLKSELIASKSKKTSKKQFFPRFFNFQK